MLFDSGWGCRGASRKETFVEVGTIHIENISYRPMKRIRGLTGGYSKDFVLCPSSLAANMCSEFRAGRLAKLWRRQLRLLSVHLNPVKQHSNFEPRVGPRLQFDI